MEKLHTVTLPEKEIGSVDSPTLPAREAIVQLYNGRRSYFVGLARRIGAPTYEDAEDRVHDAFIGALRREQHIDHTGNLKGYLNLSIHNSVINVGRHEGRKHQWLGTQVSEDEMILFLDAQPSADTYPEVAAIENESSRIVSRLLNNLNDEQRAAVELIYIKDLSYAEAAKILGVPQGTIKSRLSRALSKVGDMLKEQGFENVNAVLSAYAPDDNEVSPQR